MTVLRHSPPAEEFQRIVEANLQEVRQDYLTAALNTVAAAATSPEGRAIEISLKSPRPVEVGIPGCSHIHVWT